MPAPSLAMSTEPGMAGLYRLLVWASPAFPTGGFSYSHGLEAAAADGAVHDRESLRRWIEAVVAKGSGRVDADILRDAWRATAADDEAALAEINRRGCAYRATAELALEASQQGAAFAVAYEAAWASATRSSRPAGGAGDAICHAAAFGAAAARAAIGLSEALTGYLHAFAANLMSAGLRLGIVGQNDGQRILAALEPVIAAAVVASLARGAEDFGAATFAADIASMAHEIQYSRLFRS
jgi:urease accessory protein